MGTSRNSIAARRGIVFLLMILLAMIVPLPAASAAGSAVTQVQRPRAATGATRTVSGQQALPAGERGTPFTGPRGNSPSRAYEEEPDFTTTDTIAVGEGTAAAGVDDPQPWSFAVITDLHVGVGDGDGDYGSPTWDDEFTGQEDYAAENLRNAVELIKRNRDLYDIRFVMVTGDLTDSAELSEMCNAKAILDGLTEAGIYWIPLIGNHDVWPYCETGIAPEKDADGSRTDKYFNAVFGPQYEYLSTRLDDWDKGDVPVANQEIDPTSNSYFQNFAFNYGDIHFIALDFCSRDEVPFGLGGGVPPEGDLHDYCGGTWDWFTSHLSTFLAGNPQKKVMLFAHHAFDAPISGWGFSSGELSEIKGFLSGYASNIFAEFCGHLHGNFNFILGGFDRQMDLGNGEELRVVETDANQEGALARIVTVYPDGFIDCSRFAADVFAISASASPPEGGTVTGAATYNSGETVTLTATASPAYRFVRWTEGGLEVSTDADYSFIAESDRTLVAHFALNTYTINASAGAGGSIAPSGTVTVNHGASRSFAITPNAGYKVADVKVDGVSVGAKTSYTFSGVTADHTIAATFAKDTSPLATWYLAEGSTDWGFDCYVSIENPNAEAVNVRLTYMTSAGPVTGPTVAMPPKSQATVYPSATLGAKDFSTKVECLEGKTISVDRTMFWTGPGAACAEAHCATGVTSAATTWYMPEGSSNWGFECYLLIQNPGTSVANCQVTWMIEGEAAVTSPVTVPAASRSTFNMADFIGAKDASIKVVSDLPVIPERAMYRNNRREGHDSGGTTTTAADYYLAEGCTGFGFTTYVLVQNPQNTPTDVTITYQAAGGPVPGPSFQMPANSRKTICVNDTTVIPGDDPSFSTHVHGSQPIIAERAMYWRGGADGGEVCHDSIGLDKPHTTWYLADGQSSEGRETFTLVQNPNGTDVTVEVTYMTPSGAGNVTKTETIPANSRRTFGMADHSGINGRAAITVTSITAGKKIMCERAMYWNSRGTGTDTIGGYED